MSDEDFVYPVFDQLRDWEEWGRRLMKVLEEVKEKIGEAPVWFREDGEVFMHPDLAQRLYDPGNEGALEFLRYLKRTGMAKAYFEREP